MRCGRRIHRTREGWADEDGITTCGSSGGHRP
jgi:hypothetical protein